jgi:hypothetical protein
VTIGTPVFIEEYPHTMFYIIPSRDSGNWVFRKQNLRFLVIEQETGCSISTNTWPTREAAFTEAVERLKEKGHKATSRAIQTLPKHGCTLAECQELSVGRDILKGQRRKHETI